MGLTAPLATVSRRGRTRMILAIVVLSLVVVAGGVWGGHQILQSFGGRGQPSPGAAAVGFLRAVYQEHDPDDAARYVCTEARSRAALAEKIDQIRQQDAGYQQPSYAWSDPTTVRRAGSQAVLRSTVTLTTATMQSASQDLELITIQRNGWWVCEVRQIA